MEKPSCNQSCCACVRDAKGPTVLGNSKFSISASKPALRIGYATCHRSLSNKNNRPWHRVQSSLLQFFELRVLSEFSQSSLQPLAKELFASHELLLLGVAFNGTSSILTCPIWSLLNFYLTKPQTNCHKLLQNFQIHKLRNKHMKLLNSEFPPESD